MTDKLRLGISIACIIVNGAIIAKKAIDRKHRKQFDVVIIDDRVRRAKVCNA